MASGIKSIVKSILRHQPMAGVTRVAMGLGGLCGRAASALRAAALFPQNRTLVLHWSSRIKGKEKLQLGELVIVGTNCVIGAVYGVTLGDDVRISDGVVIETAGLDFSGEPPYRHRGAPIMIGKGAWIGTRAVILSGVTIGAGAVIGAHALVVRDVPAGAIVAGQPAEVIRVRQS